jgi:hypothetical protein
MGFPIGDAPAGQFIQPKQRLAAVQGAPVNSVAKNKNPVCIVITSSKA